LLKKLKKNLDRQMEEVEADSGQVAKTGAAVVIVEVVVTAGDIN
jgi:hypothetical protein